MNLVLADTEEFRRVKRKATKPSAAPGAAGSSAPLVENEEKRTLGLTIVRGAHIISLSVESPPPADPSARLGTSAPGGASAAMAAGPGIARPAGRGLPVGLTVRLIDTPYTIAANLLYRVLLLVLEDRLLDLEDLAERRRLLEEVCIGFHETKMVTNQFVIGAPPGFPGGFPPPQSFGGAPPAGFQPPPGFAPPGAPPGFGRGR